MVRKLYFWSQTLEVLIADARLEHIGCEMAGSLHKCPALYSNTNYDNNDISTLREELEEWREILLPLASLLMWDQPYYPVIIVAATTIFFIALLYSQMSTLTVISLAFMLVAIFDYAFPFLRPVISKYKDWTDEEDEEFTDVCETIECFWQDAIDSWHGFKALRSENAPVFLLIVLVILGITAWLGSIVDNFFLTYLIVNGLLLIPGMYYHGIGQKYTELVATFC